MSPGAGHALDASVLVLNKFYMAVHVISVRRAFCLLFKNLAEVITVDDGRYVSFNFASWRYSRTLPAMTCSMASASRTSAAVETTLPFPYLTGAGRFRSSKNESDIWWS